MIAVQNRKRIAYPILALLALAIPALVYAYDGTHTLLGVGGDVNSYLTVGGFINSIQFVSGYEYTNPGSPTTVQFLIQFTISIALVIFIISTMNKEHFVRDVILAVFAGAITFYAVGAIFLLF